MTTDPWAALETEIAAWRAAGLVATFWWRDDDACDATPALDRLLALAGPRTPLALAVVPAKIRGKLVARLADVEGVTIVQHGFAHENHRPSGEKSAEFASDRPIAAMLEEIAFGWTLLTERLGDRAKPMFVPPWNRLAPRLAERLPEIGFPTLSVFGPRANPANLNAHVDIVAWRRDRAFIGEERAIHLLVEHLAARRSGTVDPTEPTGLLTHHLDHDDASWAFLNELFSRTAGRSDIAWLDAATAAPALSAPA